jgi:phosphate transport system permease protein
MRAWLAESFRGFAFAITLLGLALLLIFIVRLGMDVYRWFHTTPTLIEGRNAELVAGAQGVVDKGLQELNTYMEAELATAGDEQEKQAIRQDYEKLKAAKRTELEETAREKLKSAETETRADTSPPALVTHFLTEGPSSEPQEAGIAPALLGSLLLALITIVCAVPLGVGAAVYLEEYKSTGWLARIIQVNINNLSGVPSVVYGILGAYAFVELIFKPLANVHPDIAARNLLGGGLTLALLTLPIVIVASQEAIRAVPVSLRHAALALGATRWQVVWHHVLPGASPGILTGVILALARALGEAAPLILFGANLFVNQNPTLFSRFTVLPLQIFGWTDRPQDAWRYNAAMASVVLLVLLLALNATAIYIRYRAQARRS